MSDEMTATPPWPIGLHSESTWTPPAAWCPRPDYWHSTDDDSTEVEVSELVGAFVRALQPELVIETGTAWGQTARAIGTALKLNGHGVLRTFEVDGRRVEASRLRCAGLPVMVMNQPSLVGIQTIAALRANPATMTHGVGFAWLDSLFELRVAEMEAVVPLLSPYGAVIGVHDCGWKYPMFRRQVVSAAYELGLNRIELPTPRGVMFFSNTAPVVAR